MTHLQKGIELFNRGCYFEAHEVLEELWVSAPRPERYFFQALIHMAVAWHHARNGNLTGARRQARKGLGKLAGYLPSCHEVDTAALLASATGWLEAWESERPAAGPAMIVFRAT
jgi:hypothetical protein